MFISFFIFLFIYFSWKDEKSANNEMPWFAPNKQAVLQSRLKPSIGPTGPIRLYRWKYSWGESEFPKEIVEKIDEFFNEKKMIDEWASGLGTVNGISQRLAPYKIYIISVNPLVLIFEEYDYGDIKERSIFQIMGPVKERWGLQSRHLLNDYKYLTKFEYTGVLHWCSPDMDIHLTPVEFLQTNTYTIPLPDGQLELKKERNSLITKRK